MKKTIMAMLSVSALLGTGTAYAQPTPPLTLTGNVTVQKGTGPVLNCVATVNFQTPPAPPPYDPTAVVATIAIDPGDPGCATIQLWSGPYPVTYDGGTGTPPWPVSFTVKNIYADTTITPGDCAGDIRADYLGGGVWQINNQVMSEVDYNTGDCTVDGFLS